LAIALSAAVDQNPAKIGIRLYRRQQDLRDNGNFDGLAGTDLLRQNQL